MTPPSPGPTWLDTAAYLSLATSKRDGTEVRTPVWFARIGDAVVLFSAAEVGKVKRLRRTGRGRIAACDVRGKLNSEWWEVTGTLTASQEEIALAHAALRRKYGWQLFVLDLGARLAGRIGSRQFIQLRLV